MISKHPLSIIGGSLAGVGTAVQDITIQQTALGTNTELIHLITYAFIGGSVGWIAKELLEFIKRKILNNYEN